MTMDAPVRPSDMVAAYICALRHRDGWTGADLAARCAEAGAPRITRSVIANIETGRKSGDGRRHRDVTVDELVTFATVFEMPPCELLTMALERLAATRGGAKQ